MVKKWHDLAVKSLSALLTGITSNHNGDFYCLNCFHSCSTRNRLKKTWKSMQWSWLFSSRNANTLVFKTLEYNYGEKSLKVQFKFNLEKTQ